MIQGFEDYAAVLLSHICMAASADPRDMCNSPHSHVNWADAGGELGSYFVTAFEW